LIWTIKFTICWPQTPFNTPIIHVDEKTCNMFGVGESIENLHTHLLLDNFLISKAIDSPINMWCVHINGNTTNVTNT
jgi:hypothetical protein